MWEALVFVLLGGAALRFGFLRRGRRPRRTHEWETAAALCGLQAVDAPNLWHLPLKTGAGQALVRIDTFGDEGRFTRIVVMVPGPPNFKTVRISREAILHWTREIEIGDVSFDNTFFIEGPMGLVFAMLDEETRRLLFRASTESQVEISNGELRAEMSCEKVPSILPLLLDIGQRFAKPLEIPKRLAENAHQDPAPGVRLQNLLLLIRELPEDPRTAEAVRTACSDPSPSVRLRAARELGAEGRDILLDLAESLEDDIVSAEAVSILGRELPFGRMRAILDRTRSVRHILTARVCLEALGRSGAADAVDALAKVMEEEEGELAPAAAQALGTTGSPAAEPSLILALQRELEDLRVAAASALGRVGSAAAVLPLKEAAERSWLDRELRRAAHQAIAEIQSRLPGATPGQLSLAGADAGQLSLAQDGTGQLSLATDSAGQLSLSDISNISDQGIQKDV
jgi:HEAT repeat protein